MYCWALLGTFKFALYPVETLAEELMFWRLDFKLKKYKPKKPLNKIRLDSGEVA